MSVEQTNIEATLDVLSIGGIDETSIVFEPGVTILAGRNATNRTSLLRGIMAALGSDDVSVKADADEASNWTSLARRTRGRSNRPTGAYAAMGSRIWRTQPSGTSLHSCWNPMRPAAPS